MTTARKQSIVSRTMVTLLTSAWRRHTIAIRMDDAHVGALLEQIRDQVGVIAEGHGELRRGLDEVKTGLGRLEFRVDLISKDVAVLKKDVAVLKTDVAVLKTD